MSEKRLFNWLKLSYTPISNYDFAIIKSDPIIQQYINSGKIYMIVQRPVLTFENLNIDLVDQLNPILTFEIHQKGVKDVLNCSMQVYQGIFDADNDAKIHVGFTYTYHKAPETTNLPFNDLANFIFKTEKADVFWFSPEKFLYHWYC